MADIELAAAVFCWTPGADGCQPTFEVRRLGDPYNDLGPHPMTAGAVYSDWKQADLPSRKLMLFSEIMSIMARDGVPCDLLHSELLKIPEYRREVLALDVPGAEDSDGG
ncbi:hypothetical protein [Aureimonas leprariae]|uniref:Uncharacterized protein n=1 Tax=Plantimonas leprariae TaxID=2615207 RepID=A0A7V7PKW7_9HYPH|nr:hypothetical protein [Aureimonas leprariae]KAB0676705.1 hypothetical protein F6X38_20610 [Aureimonas leprariae]